MKIVLKLLFGFFFLLLLGACGASKSVVKDNAGVSSFNSAQLIQKVEAQQISDEFVTAKMKFNLTQGTQKVSVGGHLKMKKDDVIQLSLVALGIMEAARIELTPDEVLVIDRINKRYIRSPYTGLSFLKDAELDFYGLQALFRNEMFVPGKRILKGNENVLSGTREGTDNAWFTYQNSKLKFQFLVALASALIQQVQVGAAKGHEETVFSWNYANFQDFNGRPFPAHHKISLSGAKGFEADIVLSNLSNDSKWETRTTVKDSYTQMDAQTMITRLLQMN